MQLLHSDNRNSTYVCVKAVVPQQSHKVDDLVDVLVVVRLIGDKHPPCIQETQTNEQTKDGSVGSVRTLQQNDGHSLCSRESGVLSGGALCPLREVKGQI